jgi:DNA polymerase III delta prime subunit
MSKNIDVELYGLDRQLQFLREWLESWNPKSPKKAVILYGPPGVGKTASVYKIAKEKNYKVVEFNTSDERTREFMKNLLLLASSSSLIPTIILLDEADGIDNYEGLAKVLRKTKKPIFMTANDINKIPSKVRQLCAEVPYYKPQLGKVLTVINKLKKKDIDYTNIKASDFRQAINVALYGSMGYTSKPSRRERLEHCLKTGVWMTELDDTDKIILLDNASRFFYGIDLYFFIKSLEVVDYVNEASILDGFKVSKPLAESRFLMRLKK